MNGKPVTSYVKITKTTYEDAPVIACVKQTPKDTGKSTCRVFKATMRREKVGHGVFSDWQYYSIGGGDEMLCTNLKAD